MYGGKFVFQKQLGWLLVGRKFVILHFWIRGQIPSTSPYRGAYIRRGDLTEGLFCITAHIWRGLFSKFYGMLFQLVLTKFFKSEPFSCLLKVDHVFR